MLINLTEQEWQLVAQLRDAAILGSAPMTREMVENIKAKARPDVPLGMVGAWKQVSEAEKNQIVAKTHDIVNHPPHYTKHPSGIECIQITEHMSFTLGNAMKYLWRADLKNGVEDLKKAAWYINREIEKRSK